MNTPMAMPVRKKDRFTLYWVQRGLHVHARLFVNGALSGSLVFTFEEWTSYRRLITRDTGQLSECDVVDEKDAEPAEQEIDACGNLSSDPG